MRNRVRALSLTLLLCSLAAASDGWAKPPKKDSRADQLRAELSVRDGDAWLALGDQTRARDAYQAAMALDPASAGARVGMAQLAWRAGQGDQALALLEQVATAPKVPAEAYALLGEIRLKRGEFAKAVIAYEGYMRLMPNDGWAKLALARAYKGLALAGDDQSKQNAVRLLKALSQGKDETLAGEAEEELYMLLFGEIGKQFRQGKLALVEGRAKDALEILKQVTTQKPDLEEAFYLLGIAYADPTVNLRAEARAAWTKAPSVPAAQVKLGMSLYEDAASDKDLDAAEKALRKAIEMASDYQEAWYYLGQVLDNRGNTKDAAEAYQKAVRIDEDSEVGKLASSKYTLLTGNVTDPSGPRINEGDAIDSAAEVQMAQQMEDKLRAEDLFAKDAALQARFDTIFEKLLAVADVKEIEPRVFIVKSDEINAVTVPGGRIFVYQGLIDFVKRTAGDRDEVFAAVLAHELAHAALRHVPLGFRSWSAATSGGNYDVRQELSRMATTLTRVHEYEADHYGLLYLTRAGLPTQGMIDLFEAMKKEMGDGMPNGSHPTKTERIAKIRQFLIDLRGKTNRLTMGDKALAEGNFEMAVRHYEVFLGVFPQHAGAHERSGIAYHRMALKPAGFLGMWKRPSDVAPPKPPVLALMQKARAAAAAGKADAKIDSHLLKRAVIEYRIAIASAPELGSARANLAMAFMDLGEFKSARMTVSEGVKLQRVSLEMDREAAGGKPGPNTGKLLRGLALLENGLAIALATAGDYAGARTYLQAAQKHDPKLSDSYYNLATVEQLGGTAAAGVTAIQKYLTMDTAPKSGWMLSAKGRLTELQKAAAPVLPPGKGGKGGTPPVKKPK